MAEESLIQIGQRLRGLREVLDIPAGDIAQLCGFTLETYEKVERGEVDPGISGLTKIAKRYDIALDVLMFGEEPHMRTYFVTRKGQGLKADRSKDYSYQSLASGFSGRKVDPYIVKVDPLPDGEERPKNSHEGQEFDMIIEGTMELTLGKKVIVLEPGDSIYFDSLEQHSMRAMNGQPCRFLCIVI